MSEKFGSFLNRLRPLSYHVNNQLKETLFKNEAYLDNRSSFIESSVVSWSNSYKKYLFLLVVLCFAISINIYLWTKFLSSYVQAKPDSNWLGILLTGQITIVGLIVAIPMYLWGKNTEFKVDVKTKTGEAFVIQGDKQDWKTIERFVNS